MDQQLLDGLALVFAEAAVKQFLAEQAAAKRVNDAAAPREPQPQPTTPPTAPPEAQP